MDPITATDAEFQLSLIRAIHEASLDGMLVVDDQGIIVSHNRRFVDLHRIPLDRLRGAQPATAIGQTDDLILSAALDAVADPDALLARVKELYDNPDLDDHCEVAMKDGRTIERHSTVLRGRERQYLGRVWFFRDITQQKHNEEKLQALACRDPLTGVANRRHFFEQAQQQVERARQRQLPLCLAEIDIDHFKTINDRHGHAAGDAVLRSFCEVAQRVIRKADLFARIGGEEFVLLLPGAALDDAGAVARRLCRATADATLALDSGDEVRCTISLGVAALRDDDEAIDGCLNRADAALYRAKQQGRNRVVIEA